MLVYGTNGTNVLRIDMDHFAGVFIAFQKRGKSKDEKGELKCSIRCHINPNVGVEIAELDKQLAPWTSHDSPGKKRADSDKDTFSVK